MPLITLVIVLAIVGFLLWLITTFIPMDARIKQIIVAVVVIIIVLWLVSLLVPGLNTIRIGPR